ncbi:oxygenase MpaB family protein [Tersicoccus sp. MR15.9]
MRLDLRGVFRRELQLTFTGSPGREPEWSAALADGDDAGFLGPGSAAWAVHGSMAPIVAGVRALMMQALHPAALAGVHDHSRFREDPLGRLAGTIRWIFTVTYGDTTTARTASEHVLRLHRAVTGTYRDAAGIERAYAANDPDLLRWVHLAFTDSFLAAHLIWGSYWGGRGSIPGGPDAYVAEWAVAGELMGVPDPPRTAAELRSQLDAYLTGGRLAHSARLDEVMRFLRAPGLSPLLQPGYRLLFDGAVASLREPYRALLGLERRRIGPFRLPAVLATRLVLAGVRLALGRRGPTETSARRRLARLRGGSTASGAERPGTAP